MFNWFFALIRLFKRKKTIESPTVDVTSEIEETIETLEEEIVEKKEDIQVEHERRTILQFLEEREEKRDTAHELMSKIEEFQENTKELDHLREEVAYLIDHSEGGREGFAAQFKS